MKRRYALSLLVLVAAVCTIATASIAHGVSEVPAVEKAAATYLTGTLAPGLVAVDARVRSGERLVDVRSSQGATALAQALGAVQAHQDTILSCGKTPADCKLRHVQTMVTFEEPVISGNTASIRVSIQANTRMKRIPVSREDKELHLTKTAAGWSVTKVVLLAES